MDHFDPQFAGWHARVRDSFARQGLMHHLGASIETLEPGVCAIGADYHDGLGQQNGFFHAGVSASLADSAGGYAALTLFPEDADVLAVEFKINLVRPAAGDRLRAVGRVLKPGRTLTVTDVEVFVRKQGVEKLCAKMQQTVFCAR